VRTSSKPFWIELMNTSAIDGNRLRRARK